MPFFYKTSAVPVHQSFKSWEAAKLAWHAQRKKLGEVLGGDASPMYSGSRSYVGGIKLSPSRELDVHWRRPDQYGYRALRSSAKPEKGASKEARAAYKVEHDRLQALWADHCRDSIDNDTLWESMGINPSSLWLSGGSCFERGGTVYLSLGNALEPGEVEGAEEILGSEYERARAAVDKAA
ncbi:hypothetical protein [Pseudomonas typographi]|uniref:hypothetical protein n=1 Tax=Pseudomonas typographi TaxID=2715964 RepID=UPI0016878A42|nr:hypothetical protein [Pseudomonas typographi]MBD1554265.1 hypothetical protein [Pseudomonas typographi]